MGGPRARWQRTYATRLRVTDTILVILVVVAAQLIQFGWAAPSVAPIGFYEGPDLSYPILSVLIVIAWLVLLVLYGTRETRLIGSGAPEYKAVFNAGIALFGVVAVLAVFFKADLGRGYLLLTVPVGTAILVLARWLHREWLQSQRKKGLMSSGVILVGSDETASHVALQLLRAPSAGYRIVGACLVESTTSTHVSGTDIPVLGGIESALVSLETTEADTLVVTDSTVLSPEGMRELGWSLEPGRHHLVMAPSLTGVSGPRIHTRPVAGLPLIHVEIPRFDGGKWIVKRLFDIVVSSLLLIVLLPAFVVVGLLVKLTSRGPVFYGQERIGLNGEPFAMIKFRSMSDGADAQLQQLLQEQGTSDVPLFKVKDDPRVTRVGRVLRKYSIDEFPQLINVFLGEMSLVGPRPQREGEVALYDSVARRRLLLKPGMSGLWQVSGRSNLSWEDAIRLDLYYVENWSIFGDLSILLRTVRQVVMPEGAH
ncbi:sugar transferase [Subtercola boreus]|uniref:Polyprenyl glycosylphosphotransferase n=2 Tax=Subtercola boreus TaxID=120213 RepID=A0A3E0W8V4_9MICO|nr:sugar transferase [Subtercola boreus]RFA18748.1 polyprenyl glycosylphosphotransferase [Subtercola boreus]RFA18865.1 polyprenyl glycosylphosphotransferase [Subtercola boreus]RFA25400.1 polyprenyl glycosylphosphotransferase [Subtercola boreus]